MPGSSAESISSHQSFRAVPQKAESELSPSRPSFMLLFRVSRNRNREQNWFWMESEMERATLMHLGSVLSFRKSEHALWPCRFPAAPDEQLETSRREGC